MITGLSPDRSVQSIVKGNRIQVLSLNEIEQVNGGMRSAGDYAVMAVGIVAVGAV